MFVMGACRATGGVQVSYSWGVTQMGVKPSPFAVAAYFATFDEFR